MKKLILALLIIGGLGAAFKLWKYLSKPHEAPFSSQLVENITATKGVLSAGRYHVMALTTDGEMFGWGSNSNMALGLFVVKPRSYEGDYEDEYDLMQRVESVLIPTRLPSQNDWRYIFSGPSATYAISQDGLGWWHPFIENISGAHRDVMKYLNKYYSKHQLLDSSIHWRAIKQSWKISAGIDTDGSLRMWDEQTLKPSDAYPGLDGRPVSFISASPQRKWLDFCLDGVSIWAVAEDGSLWKHEGPIIFQNNSSQFSSDAAGVGPSIIPLTKVDIPVRFRRVECRENATHVLMIDTKNNLWGFGRNEFGELGDGDGDGFTPNIEVPEAKIKRLTDKHWADVAIGPSVTLGIAIDGSLWGWGSSSNSQLGIGKPEYRDIPTLIDNNHTWIAVAATYLGGMALTNQGVIFTWGNNDKGLLGDGGATKLGLVPTRVIGSQIWGRRNKGNELRN